MKIGIDANEANITNQRVGVGQYAYNIISELYKQDLINEYHLYLKNPPLSDLPKSRNNWTYHVFGPQKLWSKIALPFRLFTQSFKLDFFYSPNHYSPHLCPCPTIPTIHDLGYLQALDQFNKKDIYQLVNWTKRSIFQARLIIAVSEFTKTEISRIYNIPLSKIVVIPNGVGQIPQFTASQVKNTLTKFNITKPYFLTLGTLKPNKNIPFLLSAFSSYLKHYSTKAPKHSLVIAGKKGWLFDNIFTQVKALKLEKRVVFTDYITQDEKWILLKSAQVTVLPSTYEGFGIPAIESIALGTPVIVSDIPPFREILGDSATYIDPTNISQLASALDQNPKLSASSIIKKYTWSNSAKILIDIFNRI